MRKLTRKSLIGKNYKPVNGWQSTPRIQADVVAQCNCFLKAPECVCHLPPHQAVKALEVAAKTIRVN